MSKFLQSATDVETIVTKLGLTFKLIIDPNHEIKRNGFCRDPDTVYLFAPNFKNKLSKNLNPADAGLHWKCRTRWIHWDLFTKAALRKMLIEEDTMESLECPVCFEETDLYLSIVCPQCNGRCCQRCLIKMALTDEAIAEIMQGDYLIEVHCFQCRAETCSDIGKSYYRFDCLPSRGLDVFHLVLANINQSFELCIGYKPQSVGSIGGFYGQTERSVAVCQAE